MEPRTRAASRARRHRRRAGRPRAPGSARAVATGVASKRPIRIGAPAPTLEPGRGPRAGWLALSALLHAAGFAAAVLWLSRHEDVSIDPIPIAWVRADASEAGESAGPAAAPPEAPPAPEPAPKARPPRARAAAPRPQAPPAIPEAPRAASAPADDTSGDATEVAPAASAQQADAADDGAGAAPAGGNDGAAGGAQAARPGGAAGGVGAAGVAGWMPRGGVQPRPAYPDGARRRGVEGTSHVALRLAASGRVEEVRLHRSAGDERLDDAALAAVRRWRFDAPPPGASWSGLWFVVPIEFRLR